MIQFSFFLTSAFIWASIHGYPSSPFVIFEGINLSAALRKTVSTYIQMEKVKHHVSFNKGVF